MSFPTTFYLTRLRLIEINPEISRRENVASSPIKVCAFFPFLSFRKVTNLHDLRRVSRHSRRPAGPFEVRRPSIRARPSGTRRIDTIVRYPAVMPNVKGKVDMQAAASYLHSSAYEPKSSTEANRPSPAESPQNRLGELPLFWQRNYCVLTLSGHEPIEYLSFIAFIL